jgi:hypothetical protein
MRLTHVISKIILLGSVIVVFSPGAYSSDKVGDAAKAYQATLETMRGQDYWKITAKLEEWKFEPLDTWMAENPTPKDIGKHNRTKVKFSKQEITDIFGPGGKFKVLIYNKLVGTDASNIGQINESGMSTTKDTKINLEQYTVIRVVLKDDNMVHFKVWPKLDQAGFSGGTWLRR